MIERGVHVSYETIRRWVEKFRATYTKRTKSIYSGVCIFACHNFKVERATNLEIDTIK